MTLHNKMSRIAQNGQRPYQNLARERGKTYTRTESIVVAII